MIRIVRALVSLLTLLAPLASAASEIRGPRAKLVTFPPGAPAGIERTIQPPVEGDRVRVIVQFVLPSLARTAPAARSASTHRELFERFRTDLSSIDAAAPREKSRPSTVEHEYARVFSGAAVTIDGASVESLRRLPYVQRVTPDAEVRASVEPGVGVIGADLVWSSHSTRGAGVTVAIIDTGVDYMHPALGGGIGPSFKVIGGWDFVNDDADPRDDDGHGTHVAGTVAANSADLLGVAPDARLLVYKVLDANGVGQQSDIIAALDRSVDPNGDFDFSDGADVANLSLGAPGSPDDPPSEAVDNATRLGLVVCVAAGNDGDWQSIGSPGTAASAITVGAIDQQGAVASFSSRGPVRLALTLKPDVVAPGVAIRSALFGGGTTELNGTSMATPHVAGVAALLRAIHPTWSPEQIRSAIVTTAEPVDASVMAAGAGRVDAPRAASVGTTVEPSSISFGRVDVSSSLWSSRRTIVVRNASSETRNYTITATGTRPGLSLTVDPPAFSLAPGIAREVEIVARVENPTLPFPDDGSLTHGGFVVVDDGGVRARVPYAIVKAARIRVDYTGSEQLFGIIGRDGGTAAFLPEAGVRSFEALVTPDVYDLALFVFSPDDRPNAIIAFENVRVDADRELVASYESAQHMLSFTALDENGQRFGPAPGPLAGCNEERLILGPGDPRPAVSFLLGASPDLRTSTLSDRFTVLANELCVDAVPSRVHAMQYEPIRGVDSDLQRIAGGAHLLAQPIELRIPSQTEGEQELSFTNHLFVDGVPYFFRWSTSVALPPASRSWSGTMFLDSPSDSTFRYLPAAAWQTFGDTEVSGLYSRHLRRVENGVTGFDSLTQPPTAYTSRPGERLVLGAGGVAPHLSFIGAANVIASIGLLGHLDELRVPAGSRIALYSQEGTLLAEGTREVEIVDVMARPRLEMEASTHEVNGQAAITRMTSTFGATEQDPYPPTLTSMILVDASGTRLLDRLPRGSAPRLELSAIDLADEPSAVRLRTRRQGSPDWSAIPVTITGRDYDRPEIGHAPRGTLYRAELGAAATTVGVYDVEIVVEDRAGNTTTTVIEPAFAVVGGRMRPVRR